MKSRVLDEIGGKVQRKNCEASNGSYSAGLTSQRWKASILNSPTLLCYVIYPLCFVWVLERERGERWKKYENGGKLTRHFKTRYFMRHGKKISFILYFSFSFSTEPLAFSRGFRFLLDFDKLVYYNDISN